MLNIFKVIDIKGVMDSESVHVENISKDTGLPLKIVAEYRAISAEEAAKRFLPEDLSEKILSEIPQDYQNDERRLGAALSLHIKLRRCKKEFYETEEGYGMIVIFLI
jgi:hypothetical protein